MDKGIQLSYWQVITICTVLIGSVYTNLTLSDNRTESLVGEMKAMISMQNNRIDERLTRSEFETYRTSHAEHVGKLLEKLQGHMSMLEQKMIENNIEQVRILTRMERILKQ